MKTTLNGGTEGCKHNWCLRHKEAILAHVSYCTVCGATRLMLDDALDEPKFKAKMREKKIDIGEE